MMPWQNCDLGDVVQEPFINVNLPENRVKTKSREGLELLSYNIDIFKKSIIARYMDHLTCLKNTCLELLAPHLCKIISLSFLTMITSLEEDIKKIMVVSQNFVKKSF